MSNEFEPASDRQHLFDEQTVESDIYKSDRRTSISVRHPDVRRVKIDCKIKICLKKSFDWSK